jgi:phage gpG-like protein
MLLIRFDIIGDAAVERVLENMRMRVENAKPAFDAIGDLLAEAETKQFETEGDYGSGGWAALSPKYAAWKAKHYPGKPILEATGALRGSLTSRPFGVEEVSATRAVFGTDIEYAAYHQTGTEKMPARPPMQLPEAERQKWIRLFQNYIVDGVA